MADKYIYAVARIRALEMSLMSQAAIEQLVATDSYKKAVQFIIEKGWGDSDNASMDENDILRAETDKTWAAVAEMVNDMSVFDVIRLPDLYHNLKAAIKTVVAGETPAHVFFDNAEIDGQKMLSIVSDKAWDRLPEHMRDCAREAWDCMAQAGDGQMCDAVIDRGTLLAIMQAAKKADDSLLRDYAETTVAVADIKIAVRSMKTGKNKDFMKRAMAECNTLDIDRLATAAVAGMEEIERYLADTAYAGGAEALSESASAFERWCDNRIIETIKPQKYNPFTVGPIVAYILARLNEIKTVRIILTCKLNQLPEEAIREGRCMYKIAVMGDYDSIYGFATLGLDTFPVDDPEYGVTLLKRLAEDNYAVIYMTEALASDLNKEIDRYREVMKPAIILIPGISGNTGAGIAGVKKSVEQAVGSDILFNEE